MTPPPVTPDSIPSSTTGNTAANQAAGVASSARVADAVRAVRPYCVDTASGVESAPGVKDAALVRAFVAQARRA